jgi:hypothetical protein
MKNEIGIAILDLYTQEDLDKCLNSLNECDINKENLLIVSLTENKIDKNLNYKKYSKFIQLASIRNYALSQFRIKNLKYYFILNSNQIIKNKNIFSDTIELGNVFGTWFISGYGKLIQTIEDDSGKELNISSDLNSNFLFLNSGIIKNFGYFEEKYCNGEYLDILDFVLKLRNKNLYPPNGYYPTIHKDWLDCFNVKISVKDFYDLPDDFDKSVSIAYSHFMAANKYIPLQNDPKRASEEEFLSSMEFIQKNYSKK